MDKILIFGHKNPDTDTIASSICIADLESKLGKNVESVRIGKINKETRFALDYFKVEEPRLIEDIEKGQEVILVDHNEFAQSVNGIKEANIKMVVDHHRINGFETAEPLYYIAQPVGCSATIVYELYEKNNINIEKNIAGLMLSAIISDTLLFKSPTCTNKDIKVAEKLAEIAQVDINNYGLDMLKAGTDLSSLDEKELINLDAKDVLLGEYKAVIAQVNTIDIDEMLKRKELLENEMKKELESKELDIFILAITDILNSNSKAIVLGKKAEIFEKSFDVKLENNCAYLPGVVSRKKQIIPNLMKNV